MYKTLQSCRGVAALLVVLFHLGGTFGQAKYFGFTALGSIFGWGDSGVDFFFVLSGFLIATVHRKDFGQPERLRAYVVKRVVRIYPTYWLISLAVCMGALAVPTLRSALPANATIFFQAMALIPQDPAVVGATGSAILFVAWSLQYEMLFYLVFACFIVHRGLGLLAVAALVAVNLGCRVGSECAFPASFLANDMIYLFAMGVGAAWWVRSRYKLPRPTLVAAMAGVGFVAFGAVVMWVGHDAMPFDRRLVFGALAALLIVSLAQAEAAGELTLKQRWPALLGDSSYALYLLHIPLISILVKLFVRAGVHGPIALVVAFAFIVLVCVGFSMLFYVLVERRILATLRFGPRPVAKAVAPLQSQGILR